MARFFRFLFGPFSCTRNNSKIRIQNFAPNRSPSREQGVYSIMKGFSFCKTENSHIDRPLPTELDLLNAKKPQPKIDQESLQVIDNRQIARNQSGKFTFCDNKANCYLPSSSCTSDSASWKLWIEAHVPTVILILIKTSWLLYNLIVISAIVVTTGYFTYVTIMDIEPEPTWIAEIGNLHRHGVNSLVAVIDMVVLAYPVRVLHFVYTSFYGWLYALVTFIYWSQNPKVNIIYEQIDYNKPLLILFYYTLLTGLTFVMQIFHFLAYQFKLYLKEKYLLVKKNCFSSGSD